MRTAVGVFSCSLVVALLFTGCEKATAGGEKASPAPPSHSGFAFAVYGDSRSMMYLPYTKAEEAQAHQLMVDMFDLVLPAKISQETVDKYVKLTYDPATNELIQIVMPFDTASAGPAV